MVMRVDKAAGRSYLQVYWMPLSETQMRGYGRVSVKLSWALSKVGVKVMGPHEMGWDFLVVPSTPYSGVLNRDGSVREDVIFHTMFDADFIPQTWAKILNRCGAVWVPSQWVYEIFRDSGITRPMFVAGYGVDANEFSFLDRSLLAEEPVTFITPTLAFNDRKNSLEVLRLWHKLKLPNARLIVKANQGQVIRVTGMDNILYVRDDLEPKEWTALMQRADAMVYPSSGEGFGLMPLEFACTGGLALATDYSGMQEYLHDVTMLPVQVKQIVPADLYNRIYNNEARWAEPNWDDVADKMKWVAENREQAWQMGRQAAEQVRQRWTWEQAGQVAKAALEALV